VGNIIGLAMDLRMINGILNHAGWTDGGDSQRQTCTPVSPRSAALQAETNVQQKER
jgi:hypothetical protein